jgi:hypothetical protein
MAARGFGVLGPVCWVQSGMIEGTSGATEVHPRRARLRRYWAVYTRIWDRAYTSTSATASVGNVFSSLTGARESHPSTQTRSRFSG